MNSEVTMRLFMNAAHTPEPKCCNCPGYIIMNAVKHTAASMIVGFAAVMYVRSEDATTSEYSYSGDGGEPDQGMRAVADGVGAIATLALPIIFGVVGAASAIGEAFGRRLWDEKYKAIISGIVANVGISNMIGMYPVTSLMGGFIIPKVMVTFAEYAVDCCGKAIAIMAPPPLQTHGAELEPLVPV